MVRAPDFKSGDPEFKSRSDHYMDLFEVVPALAHSQLVCLLPVGILNLSTSFQLFVSLALKSPSGERSIKYVCTMKRSSRCCAQASFHSDRLLVKRI